MILLAWLTSAHAHAPGTSTGSLRDGQLTLRFAVDGVTPAVPTVSLTATSGPCAMGPWAHSTDGHLVTWTSAASCGPGTVTYDATFLGELEPGHRHLVEVPDGVVAVHADASSTELPGGSPLLWPIALVAAALLGLAQSWMP